MRDECKGQKVREEGKKRWEKVMKNGLGERRWENKRKEGKRRREEKMREEGEGEWVGYGDIEFNVKMFG